MPCTDIILAIYNDDSINATIKKIQPIDLQDDLRQELVLALLKYDCDKLKLINDDQGLVKFSMAILMNMVKGKNRKFFNQYLRNNLELSIQYMNTFEDTDEIPMDVIDRTRLLFEKKQNEDANVSHEYRIFNRYIELKSCGKVADYYGIPKQHVWNVVKKVREELKKSIKSCL